MKLETNLHIFNLFASQETARWIGCHQFQDLQARTPLYEHNLCNQWQRPTPQSNWARTRLIRWVSRVSSLPIGQEEVEVGPLCSHLFFFPLIVARSVLATIIQEVTIHSVSVMSIIISSSSTSFSYPNFHHTKPAKSSSHKGAINKRWNLFFLKIIPSKGDAI